MLKQAYRFRKISKNRSGVGDKTRHNSIKWSASKKGARNTPAEPKYAGFTEPPLPANARFRKARRQHLPRNKNQKKAKKKDRKSEQRSDKGDTPAEKN